MKVEIELFLCEKLQFLPLEVCGLLVPGFQEHNEHVIHGSKHHMGTPHKIIRAKECVRADSQFDDDGAGFDLVHFHEGKTFCACEPLFRFVVLEFKEDSCSWKKTCPI